MSVSDELNNGYYYTIELDGSHEPYKDAWCGNGYEIKMLKDYLIFKTKEEAQKGEQIALKAIRDAVMHGKLEVVDPDDYIGDRAWKTL